MWDQPANGKTYSIGSLTFDGGRVGGSIQAELGPVDIVQFAKERLGFEVQADQMGFLKSDAKRGLVNCSRQWGKSTVAAAKAIYRAWTRPGSLVLVASPTARQSGEFMFKVRELAGAMGWRLRGDGFNKLSLLFPNGSRIVGLPGKEAYIRSFSKVSMLIIDEAARVPDAVYKALRPMLSVGRGDLWALSTPMGKRGFFYDSFEYGGERWTRFRVPATECPRIPPEFFEEERESMGTDWVRQEYLCEFLGWGGELFDRQLVEAALSDDLDALVFGGKR